MTNIHVIDSMDGWEARAGEERVGTLRALTRPDRRTFLAFRDCRPEAYPPLLARATEEFPGDLHALIDEQDRALRWLDQLGFVIARREHRYRIPTDPGRLRRAGLLPPVGVRLISAAEADLDRLRVLDDTLRQYPPGTDGWRWERSEFREETFSDGFDPATYLVAEERRTGEYVGLLRLWHKPAGPRFGFLGVLPGWRRTSVTYALVSTVFAELHRRGQATVVAEIDAANWASNAVAARLGAARTGGSLELVRAPATTRSS